MGLLNINTEVTRNGAALLHPVGNIDGRTFEELECVMDDVYDRGLHQIIVDLTHVTYVSSAGIGVLIDAQCQAQEHHGHIILVNPLPCVRNVLDVLGITSVFHVVDTLDEALAIPIPQEHPS